MFDKNDNELYGAFERIMGNESLSAYIHDIAELLSKKEMTKKSFDDLLKKYAIKSPRIINEELLDLLIAYINIVLEDHIITDTEKRNVAFLKILFKIEEGDFYKKKCSEIESILHIQFEKLYMDNNISKEEARYNFHLRDMFDLSHSQFDQFKDNEVRRALENGAKIVNLDTSIFPK